MNSSNTGTPAKRKRIVIDEKVIGHYGALRLKYIREYKKKLYRELRSEGTINEYLISINASACEAYNNILRQYVEKEGLTETFRKNAPEEYESRMNTIRLEVGEIILHDYVYY